MPSDRSARARPSSKPRLPRRLILLLACLAAVLVAWAVRAAWPRRQPAPDAEMRELLEQVAAQPEAAEPRIALARRLGDQRLAFGLAMELSLLPPSAPRELRVAAGEAWIRQGLVERGLPWVRAAADETGDPRLFVRTAAALRAHGEFQEALKAVETAPAGVKENPALQRERLRCLLDLADYPAVIAGAAPLLGQEPADGELRVLLAWAHLLQGNPEETVVLLATLPESPSVPWAEVVRGRALLALGPARHRTAAQAFARAAEADPQLLEAHLGLAEVSARERQWETALASAEKAAALRPKASEPWRILARGYAATGRQAEAEWSRGQAALADDDPAAALPPLQRAVRLRPEARFLEALAEAYTQNRQRRSALALLAREVPRNPEPDLVRAWYGHAYEEREYTVAAAAARLLARNKSPEIAAEGLGLLAQALRTLPDPEGAASAIDAALKLVPSQPALLSERAGALLEGSRDPSALARAEADLERAAASGAPVAPLYYHRAVVSLERDRPWEAFGHLCQNLTLLGNQDLDIPLALLARTSTRLRLKKEADWCGRWTRELKQADDRLRTAASQPSSAASEQTAGDAALALQNVTGARGAYHRLVRHEPGRAASWLRLAKTSQRLGLYDERVRAVERWRALTAGVGSTAAPRKQ